eukprot:107628-Amphidinium_carterae.1
MVQDFLDLAVRDPQPRCSLCRTQHAMQRLTIGKIAKHARGLPQACMTVFDWLNVMRTTLLLSTAGHSELSAYDRSKTYFYLTSTEHN